MKYKNNFFIQKKLYICQEFMKRIVWGLMSPIFIQKYEF
jgi:hypothetical protein